ncbi:hypothetical protein [Amycolatopsis sp. NPDC004772]
MSNGVVGVLLLALGGFLVGGVWSTWKSSKFLAVVLGIAALLAIGGAIFWFSS